MNILSIGFIIFILSLLVIELSFYAHRTYTHPDRQAVRRRLRQSDAAPGEGTGQNILKYQFLSELPFLHYILTRLPGIERLQLTLKQANVTYTLGFFILMSITLGFTGYLCCSIFLRNTILALPAAMVAGSMPWFYVRSKKKKRMAKFEKQLPEALGLIARALRAGHAFTSGMKLAAEEFTDPLGPYFEETLDEINFGVGVADALKNLTAQVDCPDLKFFIVSVILQRETGGNLAEIIEGLAHLMRERFKFRGRVRTLSAEGRLTGKILVAIPFLLFFAMYFLNPKYAGLLLFDPTGRIMAGTGLCLMVVAWVVIKRIVSLDV